MKRGTKVLRTLKKIILFFATMVLLLLCCLYFQCEVYHFSEATPFSGSHFYNPYHADSGSIWAKSNFHAHSIAWSHITNGHQEPEQVIDAYKKMGYDIACISNYHHISAVFNGNSKERPMSLAVYEHGYNISKTHQLVFEPSGINFFDLPFFQNSSIRQSVIHSLGSQSSCIALNHPAIRNGYDDDDLKVLSGYDLMEVFNHSVNSVAKWDTVLSAGKAVWCLGDDDVHNIEKSSELGVCWTMIADVQHKSEITQRLKSGRAFIVKGEEAENKNGLKWLQMHGDTLQLKLIKEAEQIRFVGQRGQVVGTANKVDSANYVFKPSDTYIRIEVSGHNQLIYFNPVIRYDGINPPTNTMSASVDIMRTVIYKFLILSSGAILLFLLHWNSVNKLIAELGEKRNILERVRFPIRPV